MRKKGVGMDDKQLLAEVDAIFATLPAIAEFASIGGNADQWLGRVNAVLYPALNAPKRMDLDLFNKAIEAGDYAGTARPAAVRGVLRMLHSQRHTLLMQTGGTGTVAIDHGMHFQYFEAVRGIVETATSEVFFVDPFLNENVLAKFCVYIKSGVRIRLLESRYMITLLPAATELNKQRGEVELRASEDVHDRYVFIDKVRCHYSGASFKDGPTNAPSIVNEVIDGVGELLSIYEKKWGAAKQFSL